jgi:plastocyanin
VRRRFRAAALAAACLAAGTVAPIACGRSGGEAPVRTVELHMRDYFFNGENPTLVFRPGERVRFVVTNDEEGAITHNFQVETLRVPCGPPMTAGERREVVVTMPRSGSFDYTCCTHPGMGGKIEIRGE